MSIAAIKIKQKELGLSDKDYRALLMNVANVNSATKLSDDGQKAVLRALYKIADERSKAKYSRQKSPSEAKIWACWYQLKSYLPTKESNINYMLGFIKKVTGRLDLTSTDDIATLTKKEFYKAIEGFNKRIQYEEEALQNAVPF